MGEAQPAMTNQNINSKADESLRMGFYVFGNRLQHPSLLRFEVNRRKA